jgi:hypothetical protein
MKLDDTACDLKAMEEKALEGRIPTRVRFDGRAVLVGSSANADEAMTILSVCFGRWR